MTAQQLRRRIKANIKRLAKMTPQEEEARLKVIHYDMRAYFRALDGQAKRAKKSKAKSNAKRK